MQMILGSFVFGLRETGVPYQQLQRNTSQRWSQHERVGRRAAYQNLGEGDDGVTLQGVVAPEICGNLAPLGLTYLRKMQRTGESLWLVQVSLDGLAGDMLGQWIILEVNETQKELIGNLPQKIEFELKLRKVDEFDSLLGALIDVFD